ncbi:MAG: hypothetical protein ACR2G3_05740 [Solirubrobacterales bacterium]
MLAAADLTQIDEGLWRWTTGHPEWSAGARPGSTADWPREVGSVAYASAGGLVVIDALVPEEGAEALWSWLDARHGEAGGRMAALTTIKWHRRSRDAFVARYRASTSRAARALPAGVEAIPIEGAGETMFWLPEHAALVAGDRLLGGERAGELRVCPASWLSYLPSGVGRADVARALLPLLDLAVERVLVSHGPPALRGGRIAIERAIEAACRP